MQANDLLEYRGKIIKTFKDGTKKWDAAAYTYVLKDVNKFIEEIKSMEEKINLSLFEDFFQTSPADYAKKLINIKNADENKGIVEEIKDRISDLEDKSKQMNEKEKKMLRRQRLLEKFLMIIKMLKIFFIVHQKLIKKSKWKFEESIAERLKLRKQKLNIVAERKEKRYHEYSDPEIMFKRLRDSSDEKNKSLVESINKKLTKLKKIIKNVPKDEFYFKKYKIWIQ